MGKDAARAPSVVKRRFPVVTSFLFWLALLAAAPGQKAVNCANCAQWNRPQKPFRIFGNTYYVGPHGLSSILITSKDGHILIDGALPQSAEQIAANIQSLGFRVHDVKVILNSHVHYDHAGGISELQKLTGARVLASPWSAGVMRTGKVGRGDPQYVGGTAIASIENVHELHDGEHVQVGVLLLTARLTPGHTPGGTTWTWQSCERSLCRSMVYADSVAPVSSDGFRFTNSREYPNVLQDFEKSFAFLDTTPCDILITTHPENSSLWERFEARKKGASPDPMVNPDACRELAARGRDSLRRRLEEEHKK